MVETSSDFLSSTPGQLTQSWPWPFVSPGVRRFKPFVLFPLVLPDILFVAAIIAEITRPKTARLSAGLALAIGYPLSLPLTLPGSHRSPPSLPRQHRGTSGPGRAAA